MIKLKRCPFCGGEAERSVKHDFHWKPLYFEPHCKNEYCQGYAGRAYESKKLAISMWNTRTPEIVRCGECVYWEPENCRNPNILMRDQQNLNTSHVNLQHSGDTPHRPARPI